MRAYRALTNALIVCCSNSCCSLCFLWASKAHVNLYCHGGYLLGAVTCIWITYTMLLAFILWNESLLAMLLYIMRACTQSKLEFYWLKVKTQILWVEKSEVFHLEMLPQCFKKALAIYASHPYFPHKPGSFWITVGKACHFLPLRRGKEKTAGIRAQVQLRSQQQINIITGLHHPISHRTRTEFFLSQKHLFSPFKKKKKQKNFSFISAEKFD